VFPSERDVGRRSNHRDRRPQFVRGVRHELRWCLQRGPQTVPPDR
jgi:hypothetical protein